jgi:hypothetical protein
MSGPRLVLRLPLGLIGTIALVAAIERSAFRNNPCFLTIHGACWRYTNHYATKRVRGRDILCFGDSLAKYSLLPPVFRARSGLNAYNLAVYVGPTPASYFLLRRAFEAGARPSAIVFDAAAGILEEGPFTRRRAYPWADLLTFREALELAWTARDPDLLAMTVLSRTLHSVKGRFQVRRHVTKKLRGERNEAAMIVAINERNWNRNDGGQAQAPHDFKVAPPPIGPPHPPRWRCHPVNQRYLHRFLDLAAARSIPVYWLLPPYSPVTQAYLEHQGVEATYEQFISQTQARYPNLVVVDGRHSGYDVTAFFDDAHVNRNGGSAVSAAVADIIASKPPRSWINLPRYRPIPFELEDSAQSIALMKDQARQRR